MDGDDTDIVKYRRRPLLDETSYDAESVMNGPLGLLKYQLVGAAHQDGDGATRVLNSRHLQHAHTTVISCRIFTTNTFTFLSARIATRPVFGGTSRYLAPLLRVPS